MNINSIPEGLTASSGKGFLAPLDLNCDGLDIAGKVTAHITETNHVNAAEAQSFVDRRLKTKEMAFHPALHGGIEFCFLRLPMVVFHSLPTFLMPDHIIVITSVQGCVHR